MAMLLVVPVLSFLQACLVSTVLIPHDLYPPADSLSGEQNQVVAASPSYSNDWAVQVDGGSEEADFIASSSGFINMGQVIKLYYPGSQLSCKILATTCK